MKISVEFSEKEINEILKTTGQKKKGPAIRGLALQALRLQQRRKWNQDVIDSTWSVDWPTVAELRQERTTWE